MPPHCGTHPPLLELAELAELADEDEEVVVVDEVEVDELVDVDVELVAEPPLPPAPDEAPPAAPLLLEVPPYRRNPNGFASGAFPRWQHRCDRQRPLPCPARHEDQ